MTVTEVTVTGVDCTTKFFDKAKLDYAFLHLVSEFPPICHYDQATKAACLNFYGLCFLSASFLFNLQRAWNQISEKYISLTPCSLHVK